MDESIKLESLIANIAYFYNGAASFDWLENQTLSKLISLNKEANRINKELTPKEKR